MKILPYCSDYFRFVNVCAVKQLENFEDGMPLAGKGNDVRIQPAVLMIDCRTR